MPTGWLEWLVFVIALVFGWVTLGLVVLSLPACIRRLCERLAARRLWREAARYLREQDEVIWRG